MKLSKFLRDADQIFDEKIPNNILTVYRVFDVKDIDMTFEQILARFEEMIKDTKYKHFWLTFKNGNLEYFKFSE